VISGRVTDADGNAPPSVIVEATVASRGKALNEMFGGHRGMSLTDDTGEFRIPGLAHGRYRIDASIDRRGFFLGELNYGATYYPSTANESDARWIDLPVGGEVAGVEIRLVRTPDLSIKGRLTMDGGTLSPARLDLVTLGGALVVETWSAADGTFAFRHVPPGQYEVVGSGGSTPAVKVEIKDSSVEGIEIAIPVEPNRRK
jgi:hypothetical protein